MEDSNDYIELALIFACSTICSFGAVFGYYAVTAILQAHA